MAEIIPFRGLRYHPRFVPDLKLVVAPPYDVISPEAQERYHARHPHNVVRLILGKEGEAGSPEGDRYQRAARTFAAWQAAGILQRDPEPAIYLYQQEFSVGAGHHLRRRGILALMRLHEYGAGVVFPHERTFSRYREDRLALMRACPANLEPILGVYPGPAAPVGGILERHMASDPAVEVLDEDGIRHQLWLLREPAAVAALAEALRDRPVVIADGHHRYETALTFRNERRARDTAPPAVQRQRLDNFVLANLVHTADPGLVILPTHRMIRQPAARAGEALRTALARHFRIQAFPLDPGNPVMSLRIALAELHRHRREGAAFGLYAGGGEVLLLELLEGAATQALVAAGHSPESTRLDVAILHRLVIEEILGLPPAGETDDSIQYTRDEAQALEAVVSGAARLALFVNPPRVEQVLAAAMRGERMPQKSTFFYPKVLSGLVLNPLDPAELAPA